MNRIVISTLVVAVLAGCSSAGPTATASQAATPTARASPSAQVNVFPTELFASLGDEPVSEALAAELQEVLDTSANGDGLTATVITPEGTWSGATGLAAGDRAMVPNDQMSIAHITQTIVAAQVMQLVEAG